MTALQCFHFKNRMLLANLISNLVGAVVVNAYLLAPMRNFTTALAQEYSRVIEAVFTPTMFAIAVAATLVYERPIRRQVNRLHRGGAKPSKTPRDVARRVLNEPFFAVILDFAIWIFAALFWTGLFYFMGEPPAVVQSTLISNLSVGLITCTVAFFVLERNLQKVMVPLFFPTGRLYGVDRTIRISIRTRLGALLLACNLVPFLTLILAYLRIRSAGLDPAATLELLGTLLMITSLTFIAVGLWACFLVSSNLAQPLRAIIRALQKVRAGNYDDKVQVTTNDEIGYTGDVINQMTEGLKEREQMRLSMMLAREVQQNLLPRADPSMDGLDIAGISIYCDETGGDYYDYIRYQTGRAEGMPLAVVVGDVSGHGVSAALLMATARALLRQRLSLPGDLADVLNDVNCQLARDIGVSGQFVTLMLLAANPTTGEVVWVRAGHDPAILFDPCTGCFERLSGPGVALGVDKSHHYRIQCRQHLAEGGIILLGTDGIWETFNMHGKMFGRERVLELLKRHTGDAAGVIRDRLIDALRDFRGHSELEDDVTLVVIKLDRTATGGRDTPPDARASSHVAGPDAERT